MRYTPADGKWVVLQTPGCDEARAAFSKQEYRDAKKALQLLLCSYFSAGDCNKALGSTITPIGATQAGGKILKVRWGFPGCGKSGGFRMCVVAYCDRRRVVIAEIFIRKDDQGQRTLIG